MVKKSVQRWQPAVISELSKQSVPLPPELILSVMWVESRGKPGLVNQKSGASGLMQIMPITLKDFNQRTGKKYTMSDMQSSSDVAAKKQIEVGISVISRYWRSAYSYLSKKLQEVPIDLLSRVADLFYVAGPGATRKKLDKMADVTWGLIESTHPNWNALPHPRNVFAEPITFNIDEIGSWLDGPVEKIGKKIEEDPKTGFALGILLLMAAYWFMTKGKS